MMLEFEDEIIALEQKINLLPQSNDLIVFYGSSSIRLWETLEDDLSPLPVLNLGFGGSSFSWCRFYFERLFQNLQPARMIVYGGDNDLANDIKAEGVLRKFRALLTVIRKRFPQMPLDVISIKPSPIRTHLLDETRLANDLIRKELQKTNKAQMINVYDFMLNEANTARPELFVEDQLHLNPAGYELWKGILRKHLEI